MKHKKLSVDTSYSHIRDDNGNTFKLIPIGVLEGSIRARLYIPEIFSEYIAQELIGKTEDLTAKQYKNKIKTEIENLSELLEFPTEEEINHKERMLITKQILILEMLLEVVEQREDLKVEKNEVRLNEIKW